MPTTIFQSIECKCDAQGTESCNKATGQCICNDHYCGELCQDTGSKCCDDGYYYDDSNEKCKGKLCMWIECSINC